VIIPPRARLDRESATTTHPQASAKTFTATLAGSGGQSGSPVWGSIGGCANCVFGVLSRGTPNQVVSNPTVFVRINQQARDRIRSWAAGHLLLAVDCTGSMGTHRDALITKVGELMDNTPQGTKVAAVCWGDPAEPQVLQAFTTDKAKVTAAFRAMNFGGGGDTPEDPLGVLAAAPGSYGTGDLSIGPWNSNTSADVLLVTDAPGKDPSPSGLTGPQVVESLLAGPTNTTRDGDFGSATAASPPPVAPAELPEFPNAAMVPTETYPVPDVLTQPITTSVAIVSESTSPDAIPSAVVDQYTALAAPTGGSVVGGRATEALSQIVRTITGLPLGPAATGWIADLPALMPGPTPVEVSSTAIVTTPEECPIVGDLPAQAFAVTLNAPVTDPAKVTWFYSYREDTSIFAYLQGIAGRDGNVQAVATFGEENRIVLCWPDPASMPPFLEDVTVGLRVVVNS